MRRTASCTYAGTSTIRSGSTGSSPTRAPSRECTRSGACCGSPRRVERRSPAVAVLAKQNPQRGMRGRGGSGAPPPGYPRSPTRIAAERLSAHEQHRERVSPRALVCAPAKAPLRPAHRTAAGLLPLIPPQHRQRRLGLLARRAAELEHAGLGLAAFGGITAPAGWTA